MIATTAQDTYDQMKTKLHRFLPDFELREKAELAYEINKLKRERGAIILGHNYMEPALYHSVADVVGDSLELSKKAAATDRNPIVFCGVRFMAETAKILNPQKTVLLPAKVAGCSLAASITGEDVRKLKAAFPGVPVVAYINTYAEVKAEVDACCTSSTAAKIVNSFKSKQVIFVPDEYLAQNVARETGKEIIVLKKNFSNGKLDSRIEIIGWDGRCEVHEKFTVADIANARKQFPGVVVLAHPECSPEVVSAADFSGSTSKMISFVKASAAPHFLLLTECSMGDNIIADNPEKDILRLCNVRCPHMNEITLQDTLNALRDNVYVIDIPEDIRIRAKRSLDRMLELAN